MIEEMESAVDKLHRTFDAFNRGDLESAGEWIDPDVEIGRTPFMDPPRAGEGSVARVHAPEHVRATDDRAA
jgi:ketosteroid isomerase-like protein